MTSHTAMAPNTLVGSRINLYPGGKQPKMRDTIWNGFPLLKVSAQDAKSEPSKDASNNERPFITQEPDGFAINPENDLNNDSKSNFGFTKEQTEKLKETEEKFEFQTEVSRLMKLIINSLYKTREIFLRELISNASDAIDKIRFLSLTDPNALKANPHLNITIWTDPVNKILTITDSGVGMTRQQLKENLGTIAKSGTSEFLNALEDKKADMNLIGQFGVGFYSVFLVADKVIVTTKHNDDDQYIWESQAINDFTIAKDPRGNTLGRGTQIKLHFKDDAVTFLEDDSIHAPDDDKKSDVKTKTIEVPGWELMNTQKPIWTREPKNAEGEVDFKAIVYIPSRAPDNLFQKVQDFARNIKLFVKRVFITDEFLDFIPKYLAFIKAIIDADDLPLNVSRETLQQHRALQLIKKRIIKKTLDLIADLKNDDVKYNKFLKEFGTSLKVGAIEDNENRKKIAHLLKFPSSYKGSNWTTIDDYISRMKKDQDKMYFVTGSSVEEVEKSPFIEGFVARGYEVLYMVEPIDEMLVQHMPGHGGKMFQNIAKGNIDIDKSSFEDKAQLKFKFAKLTEWMQTILTDQVEKNRLVTSPCAVVASEWGWTGHMEKIMAAQPFKQENEFMREFYAKQKKILEINPHHPLMLGLLDKVEKDQTDENINELVHVLYESTLIRSGYVLKDNLKYSDKVERILRKNLGIDLNAKPEINIVPAEDADPTEKKSSESKEENDLFKELDQDDSSDPTKPSFPHDEL
ncbi:15835_t:CDS:2 [Dentiscutata heterogama]|uniref:15835_t:CDS:1 n=1 Tax=Dentiscutata heterogama TaxID=1316150 RepID=A0ACA9LIA9_9GLOM|nr:15835_t:CDS:2 [Dentiscutata heterogama]